MTPLFRSPVCTLYVLGFDIFMVRVRPSSPSVDCRSASATRVSVVIPTYQRPRLVVRAVRSALAQTMDDIEVIVVVDGRDRPTVRALGAVEDPRLRVHVPSEHLGNGGARNAGVEHARAEWIAFLDDDDEWRPDKLRLQLQHAAQWMAANRNGRTEPVISCRLIARSETQDLTWPRRFPRAGESLSEYLFCRSAPFSGEGLVQTSTLLTTRSLLRNVPFDEALARYVDVDWLLRAHHEGGAAVSFIPQPEPQVVWHIEAGRQRICNTTDWQAERAWAHDHHSLLADRAFAAFLLTVVSDTAARAGDWSALWQLLADAVRYGQPGAAEVVTHAGNFLTTHTMRDRLAAAFAALRTDTETYSGSPERQPHRHLDPSTP